MRQLITVFLREVEDEFQKLKASVQEHEYNKWVSPLLISFHNRLKEVNITVFPHAVVFTHFKDNNQSQEENELWSLFFERTDQVINSLILEAEEDEKQYFYQTLLVLHKIKENFELTNAQKIMINENVSKIAHSIQEPVVFMKTRLSELELDLKASQLRYQQTLLEASELRIRLEESFTQQESLIKANRLAQEKSNQLDKDYQRLRIKQNSITDDQKKTQKEFVTILGIFTTIIFAAFGGIQLLSGILTNISNSKLVVSIISGSFVFISIIIILSLLFSGLSKMADLSVRSCGCTDKKTCECKLSDKHPTIFYSFLLVLIVLPFALLSRYISFETLITNTIGVEKGINWSGIPRMLEVTIFALVPAIVFYTLDSKKIGPLVKFWTWPWIVSVSRGVKNRVLSWKWIRNFFKLDKSEKKSMVEENKAHSE